MNMRRQLLPLLIGAALFLPVIICAETAEAADVYTVTYRDYDGSDIMEIPVIEGRSIQETHPSTYDIRPYWAEWHTGYYWPIDKPVTSDTYLLACEAMPPEEPADNTGYIVAAAILLLMIPAAIIAYLSFRRR